MRHISFAVLLTVAVAAPLAAAEEPPCATYGAGVTLEETTPATAILADPDAYAGRTVRVEGEVSEVCQKMGCWMELVAGEGSESLRVKVEDGEIVFPVSARGQRAVAEGAVEIQELTREQYEGWRRHLAEEQGEELDPASIGEGPFRIVQVRGTGAEICR